MAESSFSSTNHHHIRGPTLWTQTQLSRLFLSPNSLSRSMAWELRAPQTIDEILLLWWLDFSGVGRGSGVWVVAGLLAGGYGFDFGSLLFLSFYIWLNAQICGVKSSLF